MQNRSEFDWEPLLDLIGEGGVIPIVGPDLLTVETNGQRVPLYELLATRLADRLKLDGEPSPLATLNQVAACYLEGGGDLERVYSALKSVMPADADLPIPEPLLKLARITPLKLFVSTTFDNLLERAINQVRFEGRPQTQVISYSQQNPADLRSTLRDLQVPTVFQLMGRLSAVAFEYAVTEEDVLEFLHSLRSHDRSPKGLFDELNRNHVLIIGSGFSNWLARFFIRLAQNDRLWMARGKTIIADQKALDDGALRDDDGRLEPVDREGEGHAGLRRRRVDRDGLRRDRERRRPRGHARPRRKPCHDRDDRGDIRLSRRHSGSRRAVCSKSGCSSSTTEPSASWTEALYRMARPSRETQVRTRPDSPAGPL
jgi:hypothetical protein